MMLKYETAYFCGYAKLPSALATTVAMVCSPSA